MAVTARMRMVPVIRSAQQLRLLFEVERELLRTMSTLIPRVGDLDLKFRLAEHLWEDAQHARFLRERGLELTGFGSGERVRPHIRTICEEAICGEDELATLAAFSEVLKPALVDAYAAVLDEAEPLADWPTRNLLRELRSDEERHIQELRAWVGTAAESSWVAHVREVFDLAGGWDGDGVVPAERLVSSRTPYVHPAAPNRGAAPVCADAHGTDPDHAAIVRPWLEDPATDPRVIRAMIYVWLLNEADAVDYLPTIFFDTPEAPFDFHHDLARHVWDESRHSSFGLRQLPRLGIDVALVEQQIVLYDVLVRMAPHERYVMVTWHFEAGSFDVKAVVMDRVKELSDFEADTLLAFDRSDEQNHVRFGHRWLPTLLELMGDEREPSVFADETWTKFVALNDEATERIGHTLAPEERLTGRRIVELVAGSDA